VSALSPTPRTAAAIAACDERGDIDALVETSAALERERAELRTVLVDLLPWSAPATPADCSSARLDVRERARVLLARVLS
jgi:hypothetical protein